ncbi:hypothetical protein ABT390_34690 [Streptomyces aurantiacus]|uniref:Peptidase inhibitor family I36 n=1 Tax=Streptomyces aurantiacus JA 4570 TaxID=1286094 RepID=S3ZGU6_9ACTN|nr:hypothetical protein [Streptomyces aurantiacus]EPH42398.1 hypothetical protein STRAU_4538 [Streptomyces aurantiacus JA 4570]
MIIGKRVALGTAALALGGGLMASSAAPTAFASQGPGAQRAPGAGAAVVDQAIQQSGEARRPGCAWPNVCFYKGNTLLAKYKDMGYQNLGPRAKQAKVITNSRRDDGAKLYFVHTSGQRKSACLKPRTTGSVNPGWKPYAIDIRNSPSCR